MRSCHIILVSASRVWLETGQACLSKSGFHDHWLRSLCFSFSRLLSPAPTMMASRPCWQFDLEACVCACLWQSHNEQGKKGQESSVTCNATCIKIYEEHVDVCLSICSYRVFRAAPSKMADGLPVGSTSITVNETCSTELEAGHRL